MPRVIQDSFPLAHRTNPPPSSLGSHSLDVTSVGTFTWDSTPRLQQNHGRPVRSMLACTPTSPTTSRILQLLESCSRHFKAWSRPHSMMHSSVSPTRPACTLTPGTTPKPSKLGPPHSSMVSSPLETRTSTPPSTLPLSARGLRALGGNTPKAHHLTPTKGPGVLGVTAPMTQHLTTTPGPSWQMRYSSAL